ncbi:unnamed protein product, partial [Rotaria socialis]
MIIYILDNDDNCDSDEETDYYSLATDAEDESESEYSETENECKTSTKNGYN